MELQLVNKEIALTLKELGFDWIDVEVDTIWICNNTVNKNYENIRAIKQSDINNVWFIPVASVPTQALTIKWLRDVHTMYVNIKCYDKEYQLFLYQIDESLMIESGFKSYELAEEAGILKALKILKNK